MSGGCSCRFPVVSQHANRPADHNEAAKSRKLLINLSLHQTSLLIWALLPSRVSGIKPVYLLYPWQLSKDGVNLEASVSLVTLAEP